MSTLRRSHVRSQEKVAVYKPASESSPETKSAGILIMDYEPSELVDDGLLVFRTVKKINACCLNYPIWGILSWQPE